MRVSALDGEFGEAFCDYMLPELRCLIVEFVVLVPYFANPANEAFALSECGTRVVHLNPAPYNPFHSHIVVRSECYVVDLFRPRWRLKIQSDMTCAGNGAGVEGVSFRYPFVHSLKEAMYINDISEWQFDFRGDRQLGIVEARVNLGPWKTIFDQQKNEEPFETLVPYLCLERHSSATFLPLPQES